MTIDPQPSGGFTTGSESGDTVLAYVRAFAEKVVRQDALVRREAARLQSISRQIDYGEEWSPSELEYETQWRVSWGESVTLLWACHQLDQWLVRLDSEMAAPTARRKMWKELALLRNAFEHLNEAYFDSGLAEPGEKGNRSLRQIYAERGRRPIESVDIPATVLPIVRQAQVFLNDLEDKADRLGEDMWVQNEIDRRRGK